MNVTEAKDRAKALRTDGKGVYAISLEQWVGFKARRSLMNYKRAIMDTCWSRQDNSH